MIKTKNVVFRFYFFVIFLQLNCGIKEKEKDEINIRKSTIYFAGKLKFKTSALLSFGQIGSLFKSIQC